MAVPHTAGDSSTGWCMERLEKVGRTEERSEGRTQPLTQPTEQCFCFLLNNEERDPVTIFL